MSREALGTYLNDHLAGSVGAVEMVRRAAEDNAGTPLGAALTELAGAIREDQAVLRSLLERLEIRESPLKRTGAWLMEKAGRLKTERGRLHRLEMLEALGLGIQGKLALWRTLQRVGPRYPALAGVDFVSLERRALVQHERTEAYRLEAAAEAL